MPERKGKIPVGKHHFVKQTELQRVSKFAVEHDLF